jgi:FMN reductase (NADPH)
MNNPTLDLIHKHASVRRYRPDPLPASVIETVAAAGQRAASSSNVQAYSVVAVTDAAKRQRLAELCGNQKHVAEAPVFLAWCADLARLERACSIRGYAQVTRYTENFLVAAVDAALAAQNATLAAESLGLGACYIGSIRNDTQAVIELLALPRLVFPIVGMTLGWPEQESAVKPRLPLPAVLHWETYNPEQDAALQAYDQTMAATGIYEGRQVEAPGKPDVMEAYGWLEHTARRVSQIARAELKQVLQKQGFALE